MSTKWILVLLATLFSSSELMAFSKKNNLSFGYQTSSRSGATSQRLSNESFRLAYQFDFSEKSLIEVSINNGSREDQSGIVSMRTEYTDYMASIQTLFTRFEQLRLQLGLGLTKQETKNGVGFSSSVSSETNGFVAIGFKFQFSVYDDFGWQSQYTENLTYEMGILYRNQIEDPERNIADFNLLSLGYQF